MDIISNWICRKYFDPDSTYVGAKWFNGYAVCEKEVKLHNGVIRYEDVMDMPVEVLEVLAGTKRKVSTN